LTDLKLDSRVLLVQNEVAYDDQIIRGWHLDQGDKLMVGLWYFKETNEGDEGGHLLLRNGRDNRVKKVVYDKSNFIVLPNFPISWHAISPRKRGHPRKHIDVILKSEGLRLHSFQRDEFKNPAPYVQQVRNFFA
jgi:hypothetical protein